MLRRIDKLLNDKFSDRCLIRRSDATKGLRAIVIRLKSKHPGVVVCPATLAKVRNGRMPIARKGEEPRARCSTCGHCSNRRIEVIGFPESASGVGHLD